jgi:geranylgeranyl diphosphate synthase, type I
VQPSPTVEATRLRELVQAELDEFVAHQRSVLAELGAPMDPLVDAVEWLLQGGKRLRAAFLYWGYRAVGGPHSPALVRAAVSMELFQAAALLHDDVMDDSDLRRGRPTAHRSFATRHTAAGWSGSSERFGQATAILAGDLCLTWSDEMFAGSGLPPEELQRARGTFDAMRTQLMGGQFLDVLESARGWDGLGHAERVRRSRTVIRFKSGKYSVEQPLLIGARAGGADARAQELLSAYGLHLGEAFQLRDDVLGVFGDPAATGKPAGDDLREGKRTVLIAHALDGASAQEAATLVGYLGDHDLSERDVERARDILVANGALERTEAMIAEGARAAAEALDGIPDLTDEGRAALSELITVCTTRTT